MLIGLPDEMRRNPTLQRDLNKIFKPNPEKKLGQCEKFFQILDNGTQIKKLLEEWSMKVSMQPLLIDGYKIDAGNIQMKNQEFPSENIPDFDRQIQCEMLIQIELKNTVIFCRSIDKEACQTFLRTLKQCSKTYNYPMEDPQEVFVESENIDDWQKSFQNVLEPKVKLVILLLPGKDKSSPLYNACKTLLLTTYPIPSQVVLIPTIANNNKIRATINKILTQICAKVGGTPWSLKELPFTDEPIMVVGMDVFQNKPMKNLLLSFCATVNKHLSRYWSRAKLSPSRVEVGNCIQAAVQDSMLAFKKYNEGKYPKRLVVFRNDVSDFEKKTIYEIEVKAFLRAFNKLAETCNLEIKPELLYICINRKNTAKFFNKKDPQKDVFIKLDRGTVISKGITTGKDFYLISQKPAQGIASSSHYFILSYCINNEDDYNETNEIPEEVLKKIQVLTYKLCFMYYHQSGSIKVPAPIQYARKLSEFIVNRWTSNDQLLPHEAFESYIGLYFI